MEDYQSFIDSKMVRVAFDGVDHGELAPDLFPFQADLTRWALRKGRAAIFADTGLGKTHMQTEWAAQVAEHGRVLILAPLAVADQTVSTAKARGIDAEYTREDTGGRIVVTNYEMLDRFNPSEFAGVVLDESSILKSYNGKTRNALIQAFQQTPYRLACTATPAPNDHMELGNHSEFLGAMTRQEMLSEFFVHDGHGGTASWRLKGHARESFWRWVASWGAVVRSPVSLGYDEGDFTLPPLNMETIQIDTGWAPTQGELIEPQARTLNDQRRLRKATLNQRVDAIAKLVADEPDEPWIIWCEYNREGDAIESAIPGCVQISGSDSLDVKRDRLIGFGNGDYRVLVTKPSIAGFGMNWQHCARHAFFGPSHSYEQTYQAIRRSWRFGQKRPVSVYTAAAASESRVVQNYERKERSANEIAHEADRYIIDAVKGDIKATDRRWNPYKPETLMEVPSWLK